MKYIQEWDRDAHVNKEEPVAKRGRSRGRWDRGTGRGNKQRRGNGHGGQRGGSVSSTGMGQQQGGWGGWGVV